MTDEQAKAPDAAVPEGDEAEMMARLQEEIRNLPVSEHVVYMMHSLSNLAVGRLGLTEEGGSQRDPAQARLAIDAFKALMGVVEQSRPAGEMAAHRGMLSQLQLAYAAALGSDATGSAPGSSAEGTETEGESASTTAGRAETEDDGLEAGEISEEEGRPKERKRKRGDDTGQ